MKKIKIKLFGLGASPGLVKGKVWLIKDPVAIVQPKPGYIIIAPFTTPVIAPAIATAKAIVCEKGGITAHAAIIAREFGIPCVVGVKNVLETFRNNQMIVVDANKGIVYEA